MNQGVLVPMAQKITSEDNLFYMSDVLPAAESMVSQHWKELDALIPTMHRDVVTNKPTFSWSFVTTSSQPSSHMTGFFGLNSHSC